MKFQDVLQIITEPKFKRILNDASLTDFQKAADIHAELEADADAETEAKQARRVKKQKQGQAAGYETQQDKPEELL